MKTAMKKTNRAKRYGGKERTVPHEIIRRGFSEEVTLKLAP